MSERIVVAVDGRAASSRALEWAAHRAAATNAQVTVLQALDLPAPPVGTREHAEAIERVAESIGDAALTTLLNAGVATGRSVVERGNVVDVIEQASQAADLVVVGTNGAHGPFAPTTRAVRVAAASAVPVVVIPDLATEGRHDVVVGIDGSPSSTAALAFAAAQADRTGEKLVALSTWHIPAYAGYEHAWPIDLRDQLAEDAHAKSSIELAGLASDYPDLVIERRVLEMSAAEALVDASRSAALVVVGSRGLGRVRRLLLGSVSQSLVQHAKGPIAVVR